MQLAHYTDLLTLKIGEVLNTSSQVPTRYWLSKFNPDSAPMYELLLGKNPPATPETIVAKQVLDLVGSGFSKAKLELLKEYLFEDIRQMEFPDLPSRIKATFFLDNDNQAENSILRFSPAFAGREKMVFIGIKGKYNIFKADANFLNCNTKSTKEILAMARGYWRGESLYDQPLFEILGIGHFSRIG